MSAISEGMAGAMFGDRFKLPRTYLRYLTANVETLRSAPKGYHHEGRGKGKGACKISSAILEIQYWLGANRIRG